MQTFDVVVPGHYFCDIIFTGLAEFPKLGTEIYSENFSLVPGGGALNTAIALRRLGVNVGWAGALGNDFFSQTVRQHIESEQIETSLVMQLDRPLRRVTVALSYPSDRAFVSYIDPPPQEIEMLRNIADRTHSKLIHFSGLTIHEDMPALLDELRKRGTQISMDCQHREETIDYPLVRDILSRLDFFMPNASETQQITRTESLPDAFEVLSKIIPCIVVKNGAQGATACTNGTTYHQEALEITPIDTTGAGDVFNAGFLAAHLAGHPIQDCLRWGNFCGGQSTLGFGGSLAPTKSQLDNWLAHNRTRL
jgi:sugar/nucleoside kinase (ribokinase family)